jgi:class 3 adenylate cyclase/tetratricopeptide (TPR) repeat protein
MLICPGCGEENPPKFRLCGYCGAALATAAPAPAPLPVREMRKTVTIVFSDLKDSTALGERIDTEALHEVKERYFGTMAAEIVRHGGKVEKYIGDAIMAVFGLPKAHEDDALRAVRAAHGMRVALERLNQGLRERYGVALANRTGVNTGEVVANDDPSADQKLATGDAVNVAARLEQAAPVDQIYLGETTWRLVRDAVEVEAVEPLALKGKSERVAAYRLVSAAGLDGNVRRVDTPLAGRDAELAALNRAWTEVGEQRAVRLVTVIGEAGMGKSRLIHEVVQRHGAHATVLRGRCLPYGDGITFWPLVEMARALIREDDSAEAAVQRLAKVSGDADVAVRLASVLGLSNDAFPLSEINWAARRLLQGLAAERPVIALIDDIHWAEPAFLELLEHVLDAAKDAPILMLATARHELVEERATWPDRPNASRVVLHPLSMDAAESVVLHLLGPASLPPTTVARIVKAAEGNPLYVEQMLSMLVDSRALQHDDEAAGLAGMAGLAADAGDEIVVPPTIRALLEARLDRLAREERATVEPASVVGLEFTQTAIESLVPSVLRNAVPRHLSTLSNRHFIQPASARERDADTEFRFHHHLVRDTVYNGLLKRARATLHLEFVRWQDRVNAERDRGLEFEEILGYHLEQAHRYLSELGPLNAEGRAIGEDAARRLANAAERARARGDLNAAANLFKRATTLLPADHPHRISLLPDYGETLMGLGDFAGARTVLADGEAAADRLSDARVKASSQIVGMFVRLFSAEQGEWGDDTLRRAHELIPIFERDAAHGELARAWRLIAIVHAIAGRYTLDSEAAERSIHHARLAGNDRLVARIGGHIAEIALMGTTPVKTAIEQCQQLLADGLSDRHVEGKVSCTLAQLKAMNGELQAARALYRRGRAMLRELGQGVLAASTGIDLALVELLGGDLALAEREVRQDYDFLTRAGESYYLSTVAALLSRLVRDQGRDEEALALSLVAERATAADDADSQALWRAIRAPIVARAGDLEAAESLARTAVALARQTEAPAYLADALIEMAAVLQIGGQPELARSTLAEATALYTAKGNEVAAARCAAWSATL